MSWLGAILAVVLAIGNGTCRAYESTRNPRYVHVPQACIDNPLDRACMDTM